MSILPRHTSEIDQDQAEAREWFADAVSHAAGQAALLTITVCLSADNTDLSELSPVERDCVYRLALLKIHELCDAHEASLE